MQKTLVDLSSSPICWYIYECNWAKSVISLSFLNEWVVCIKYLSTLYGGVSCRKASYRISQSKSRAASILALHASHLRNTPASRLSYRQQQGNIKVIDDSQASYSQQSTCFYHDIPCIFKKPVLILFVKAKISYRVPNLHVFN